MKNSTLSIKYGVAIYFGLIGYFFLMKIIGLEEVTELRVFNFFIILFGLYRLIRTNIKQNGVNSYFNNFYLAIQTSFLSILLFTISLIGYLLFINPEFMMVLENSKIWGQNLSVVGVSMAILVEGTASSFMIAFILMQYYKSFEPTKNSMI